MADVTDGIGMAQLPDAEESTPGTLRRVITLPHAVAIYVSSVLGAGILIIPGLAARAAGPASLIAWILLSLASYPFAYTFARLSARKPESGGIYAFAREGYGPRMSTAVAWLFVAWDVLGAPAATVAAASYLAFAFALTRLDVFLVAGGLLGSGFLVNYLGIRFSGRVQLATVAAIIGALVLTVAVTAPSITPGDFEPFLPNGPASIGVAAALIVWSYLGYENTSNVAEEFKDPKRDFDRAVVISVALISTLYLAVAIVTVGTGAYTFGGGVTPFAEMMANAFGTYGATVVAFLAVFVTFGTVNAYTAGMARVVFAAARDGIFPRALAAVHRETGAPRGALLFLITLVLLSLAGFYALNVDIQSAFLMTSGAAILVYIIGSAAGIRLLKEKGLRRALPWISLAVSVALLPFIGTLLAASAAIAGLGLLYSAGLSRRRRVGTQGSESR